MTAASVTAFASSPDIPCGQTAGAISINPTGGTSPFTYSIDGTNFQSNNVFNNVAPGSYNIKVKDNKGCTTDVAVALKSQNTPVLIITNPPSSCLPINITTAGITTGSDAGLTYSYWTNSNATNVLSNPGAINLSGTYYIKAATTSGCFDIKPVTLTINTAPIVQIINPPIICEPAIVDLTLSSITNGSEVGLSYTYWNDSSGTVLLANPRTISTSGIYFISGKTAAGCSTTKPVVVTILNKIEGIRYPSATAISNVPLTLHARTIAANYSYQWSPPEGLNFSTIQDPTYKYDRTTQYLIKMTSEQGCITIDTALVTINPLTGVGPTMFVPKAWSPNGDGHNDYLFPLAVNIKELKYFRIFNRWGTLMFESSELLKGWNGQLNGQRQPMDVYTWIIEAIGINGERIKLMGNSVLLR